MAQPAVANKAAWWSKLIDFAGYHKTNLHNNANDGNSDLGLFHQYYDGAASAFKILDYTSDSATWTPLVNYFRTAWNTYYVLPNNGGVTGFRKFTHGNLEDVLRNNSFKTESLNAMNLIAANGAYSASGDVSPKQAQVPLDRECAYSLETFINLGRARALTPTETARRDQLFEWCLAHLDSYTNGVALYMKFFMAGLVCRALVDYWGYVAQDARIPTKIKAVCDYAWGFWDSVKGAWPYADKPTGEPDDGYYYADTNMLLAPAFAWIWYQRGIEDYRTRANTIFQASIPVYSNSDNTWVSGAYVGTAANPLGKQWNQQLYWGPKLITWLESDPLGGPIQSSDSGLQPIPVISRLGANFAGGYGNQVIPSRITIDQANQKFIIYQPALNAYAGLVGAFYSHDQDHTLTFYSGDTVITKVKLSSFSGLAKEVNKFPLLFTNVGEPLKVESTVTMDEIIFYVVEKRYFDID